MVVIAYAHDGTSVYDPFFLEYLTKENTVYFLTFNRAPRFVDKAKVVKISEPFTRFTARTEWIEGFRMYALCLLRSLLFKLHLRRIKPDIVMAGMATKYGFYSALAGFRPFILIVWGTDVLIAPKRFFLLRFMAKFSLAKADAVILDSKVQKIATIQLGCRPEKILKFPWFDLERVRVEIPREKVRKKLGWDDNLVVVSTRSHEPIYGVEYLVETIPQVIKEVPECRFLIIGGGRLTKSFQERVSELKVEKYVRFTGSLPREDVVSYLNAADLNVSASLSDGTSASLLEAMALGVPSVVTDIPGNKEWIENDLDGCLVPVKESQKLAKAIVSLLKDENVRRKIGEKAMEKVNAVVNWRKNSQFLNGLIYRLVQESRRKE